VGCDGGKTRPTVVRRHGGGARVGELGEEAAARWHYGGRAATTLVQDVYDVCEGKQVGCMQVGQTEGFILLIFDGHIINRHKLVIFCYLLMRPTEVIVWAGGFIPLSTLSVADEN
jgi:hypothetical protein